MNHDALNVLTSLEAMEQFMTERLQTPRIIEAARLKHHHGARRFPATHYSSDQSTAALPLQLYLRGHPPHAHYGNIARGLGRSARRKNTTG